MYKKAKPFFIHCISPLHAGSGSDLGIVDLPIQRERHTSFPKIEGSSLKGAMREKFREDIEDICKKHKSKNYSKDCIKLAFGHEKNGDEGAGALGFTDARLLLFPVKSMKGVFAWITCPKVLKQFETDMKLNKDENIVFTLDGDFQTVPEGSGIISSCSEVKLEKKVDGKNKIILEEYTFEALENEKVDNIFKSVKNIPDFDWEQVKKKLVILSDDDFRDFVNLSTEVITRTKISTATGTVDKETGALWTEEYLPAESVLYSLALAHDVFKDKQPLDSADDVLTFFENGTSEYMQIGGNATVGKGIVRIRIGQDGQDEQDKETV